jgi:hypothetical protein
MNISLGKLFATAFMAAMLVSSGTAWALQNCTFAREAADHAHVLHDQSADRLTPVEHPQHPVARIHCPENHMLNVSLGVTSSAFRLDPPKEDSVKMFPVAVSLNGSEGILNGFDQNCRAPLLPHLPSHLFLARLRI